MSIPDIDALRPAGRRVQRRALVDVLALLLLVVGVVVLLVGCYALSLPVGLIGTGLTLVIVGAAAAYQPGG